MEFYPANPSVQVASNPGVVMQGGCCAPSCCEKKERSNVISTETIAIHTITNIILWSFAALVIGGTPGVLYSNPKLGANQDGQNQGDIYIFLIVVVLVTIIFNIFFFSIIFIFLMIHKNQSRYWSISCVALYPCCCLWRKLSYSCPK